MSVPNFSEILLSASVTIFVAWLAIRAAASRDKKNHRREKLETLYRESLLLDRSVLDVAGKIDDFVRRDSPPDEASREQQDLETSIDALNRKHSFGEELKLMGLLWFPEVLVELGRYVDAQGAMVREMASVITEIKHGGTLDRETINRLHHDAQKRKDDLEIKLMQYTVRENGFLVTVRGGWNAWKAMSVAEGENFQSLRAAWRLWKNLFKRSSTRPPPKTQL